MDSSQLCLLMCAVVSVVYVSQSSAATSAVVLGTSCTDPSNCSSITHAECSGTTHKCQCAATFKEVNKACTPKVIDKACTNKTESTVCTLEHSVCTSLKCACKTGYTNKDDTCLKILGTACSTSNATTVCKVANSGCSGGKCSCNATYVEENAKCPNAAGKTCTAPAECITNADCDKTSKVCKCKDGFVNTNGLCSKQSSAVSNKVGLSTVGILLILNVILKMY